MRFILPRTPATRTARANVRWAGSRMTITTAATAIPPSMTTIWCFCVWLTARVPPATV